MEEENLNETSAEPAATPRDSTNDASAGTRVGRRMQRRGLRLWLLFAVLIICIAVAWVQRPRLAALPNLRARAHLIARDDEAAGRWLGYASMISRQNPETEFLLGRYRRHQGRLDDAGKHLKRAYDLGYPPELLQREQWLGMAQAGQLQEADPYLPHLLADPGGDTAEISEAYVIGYLKQRRFETAILLITAWMQDHPLDPQPHFWRALIERENDHPDAAERSLRWALDLKPDHTRAAFLLADVLAQDQRKFEEALPFYELAATDSSQWAAATTGRARALRGLGRQEEAVRDLKAALQKSPGQKDFVVELTNSLSENGQYDQALAQIEPMGKEYPTDRDVRYALGVALRGTGQADAAKPHLEFATNASKELARASGLIHQANQNPTDAEVRYEIGRVMLEYGLTRDGLIWLDSAVRIDPKHQKAHEALAAFYASKATTEGPEYARLAAHHRKLAEPTP